LAPEAIRVKVAPAQIDPLFTVITGKGFTVTLEMAGLDEIHPNELVPLTK
jgi:hypothetical protein